MSFAGNHSGCQFKVPHAAEDDVGLGDCRLGRLAETG